MPVNKHNGKIMPTKLEFGASTSPNKLHKAQKLKQRKVAWVKVVLWRSSIQGRALQQGSSQLGGWQDVASSVALWRAPLMGEKPSDGPPTTQFFFASVVCTMFSWTSIRIQIRWWHYDQAALHERRMVTEWKLTFSLRVIQHVVPNECLSRL